MHSNTHATVRSSLLRVASDVVSLRREPRVSLEPLLLAVTLLVGRGREGGEGERKEKEGEHSELDNTGAVQVGCRCYRFSRL